MVITEFFFCITVSQRRRPQTMPCKIQQCDSRTLAGQRCKRCVAQMQDKCSIHLKYQQVDAYIPWNGLKSSPTARKSVSSKKSARKSVPSEKSARKSVPSKKSARKSVPSKKSARKSVPSKKSARKSVSSKKSATRDALKRSRKVDDSAPAVKDMTKKSNSLPKNVTPDSKTTAEVARILDFSDIQVAKRSTSAKHQKKGTAKKSGKGRKSGKERKSGNKSR